MKIGGSGKTYRREFRGLSFYTAGGQAPSGILTGAVKNGNETLIFSDGQPLLRT